jgi:type IV secretory pathway TraG/TraD family ATPase VirD4
MIHNTPALFGPIVFGAALALYLFLRFRSSVTKDTHGESRWARSADLRLLRNHTAHGNGIVLGWLGRNLLTSPAEDSVVVFGAQRSGKTAAIAIPTLLEWAGSAVATSTKDELVRLTGRHRLMRGPAFVFAPLDRDIGWITELGLEPVHWNPLTEIDEVGLAAELADILTADGKVSHAPHWYLSAANVLTGLFVLEHQQGGTLASVLDLLNRSNARGYAALAAKVQGPASSILKGFALTPPEEGGSILSTARACLSPWLDERIARATSSEMPQLDLDRLLAQGGTLYLVAPTEDAERCRPLFSALLGNLLRRATERARLQGGVLNPRLLLALDEAANFARVPRLPSYVSTGPGQGIQSLLCFHDMAQVEAGYGQQAARTIWNNCRARLLLPGQGDLRTLQQFSEEIGNQTVRWKSQSWNARGSSSSEARAGLPLCPPDALRRSKDAVLLYADAPPASLRIKRWDQVPHWRTRVEAARASPQVTKAA